LLDAGPEAIDVASEYLVEIISGFVGESTIKSMSGRKKNNKKALDMIENEESAKSKCPRKATDFYKFVAEFKNGVEKDDPIVPKLLEFHQKLTTKLHDLNVGDPVKIKETVRKIWMDEPKTKILFPTKKVAKKIILSTSNSGARDFLGLSLAQTKTFFRRSTTGFDMYYNICKAISLSGYIPHSWLTDSISFLFKKKGKRSDPSNWRPITIAPSLGKHNEKLIGFQLKKVRDKNSDNHAYCELKSCVTAIMNVSEHFKKLRIRQQQLKRVGKQLVVVFSAEDISSAFESIDHGALDEFCKMVFDEDGSEVKIRLLIKNYLTRTSFVVDRETKEKLQVIKRYDDRTSPQGSILSPAFWRIFDKIFSQIYKDDLDYLVIQNDFLEEFHHVAYSDDHVTIFSFVFDIDEDEDFIHDILAATVVDARNLLDNATKSVGCGINRKKSETLVSNNWILVQERWANVDEKFKSEINWLGYSFGFDENLNLVFTETKMKKSFNKVKLMMFDVFQYVDSIYVRWKIYRIYISPVIEWYIPTIITDPGMKQDSFRPSNTIEIFQQMCLAEVLGVTPNVSRDELNEIMCEKSVKTKVGIVANRLAGFCERDLNMLKWANGIIPQGFGTRSLRQIQPRWDGVEKGDLGDWMHMIAEQHRNQIDNQVEIQKRKFDDFSAQQWGKMQNERIYGFILERSRGKN